MLGVLAAFVLAELGPLIVLAVVWFVLFVAFALLHEWRASRGGADDD